MKDLWPSDIATHRVKSPVVILREQASLLGKKTSNIIQAEVQMLLTSADADNEFGYAFFIVAPALNNYRYQLLTVWHQVDLYPVQIFVEGQILEELGSGVQIEHEYNQHSPEDIPYIAVDSEEQFLDNLAKVFGSSKTKRVITALLSQSDPYWKPPIEAKDIPF